MNEIQQIVVKIDLQRIENVDIVDEHVRDESQLL
jgi:hypothetical protein